MVKHLKAIYVDLLFSNKLRVNNLKSICQPTFIKKKLYVYFLVEGQLKSKPISRSFYDFLQ